MSDADYIEEIIGPEGIEERLIEEISFRVTMTQGGKFRVYMGTRQKDGSFDWTSKEVCNTKEEAGKSIGLGMIIFGSLRRDPETTINAMLKGFKK